MSTIVVLHRQPATLVLGPVWCSKFSAVVQSVNDPCTIGRFWMEPIAKDKFVHANYPPGLSGPPEFTDMTIVVCRGDELFSVADINEVRAWFGNHSEKEEIMGPTYKGEHAALGPNYLLEKQTNIFSPKRWLRLRFVLFGTRFWITFVLRGDNSYVKGLANDGGQYQIPEAEQDGSRTKVTFLPEDYAILKNDWDLKYRSLLGCEQTQILGVLQSMVKSDDFLRTTITYLSNFRPFSEADHTEAKRRAGALIFRGVEFVRMNLSVDDEFLLKKVQGYLPLCKSLRHWKLGDYLTWIPKKKLLKMDVTTLSQALSTCVLVLNVHQQVTQEDKLKPKRQWSDDGSSGSKDAEGSGSSKETQDGEEPTAGRDGSGENQNNDDKGKSNAEDETQVGGQLTDGEQRIQILGLEVNCEIEGINIYDKYRGQKIYRRRHSEGKQPDGLCKLHLDGPARAINSEDLVGAEIFFQLPRRGGNFRVRRTAANTVLRTEQVQWYLGDTDDGLICLAFHTTFGRGHFKKIHIPCLVMNNAVEAEVEVKLLAGSLDGEEATGSLDGEEANVSVRAGCIDYKGRHVTLLSGRSLHISSAEWTDVPLDVCCVCLPYRSDMELTVDVNLDITKPFASSKYYVPCSFKFTAEATKVHKKIGRFEFEANVRLWPDPQLQH